MRTCLRPSLLALILLSAAGPATCQLVAEARNAMPRGVAESTRLDRLTDRDRLNVAITLPLADRAALDDLRYQLHDPASPRYHQWLTSEEIADRFCPSEADYAKLVAWARAKGLELVSMAPNRLVLNVRGTAPRIEAAFSVRMHTYRTPEGRTFHSPDRPPAPDLDLAITSINGLNDLVRPSKRLKHLGPTPHAGGSGTGGLWLGRDFREAYAYGVPLATDGRGQGIALFELSQYYPVDVTNYFRTAGLPEPAIRVVKVAGGATGYFGEDEVALDLDLAGSVAPGATLYDYEGDDPTSVLNRILTDGACRSVGISWGWATDGMTLQTSIDRAQDEVLEAMDAAGIAVFAASGDSGAWTARQWAQSVASSSFSPINPADEPYLTCVGATELATATAGGPWSSEAAWPFGGSGFSHRYPMPSYQKTGIDWSAVDGASTTMRNCVDVASVGENVYLDFGNGTEIAENVGGTSCAAPLWAALAALANQTAAGMGRPVMGFLNPLLYRAGTGPAYAARFHDVTAGYDGLDAGPGFDLPTGWGTPVGLNTLNDLIGATCDPVLGGMGGGR